MSSISRTASVANSFDTKSQDSALLSRTLADLFTNNTNHRGRPTITPAQIELVKKAIRSYFRSAPTDDYREIIDAEGELRWKIWWAIEANNETVSLAGQVGQTEARHHKPNKGGEQFVNLKGIFVDYSDWSKQGFAVELNGSEESWDPLQVHETGREYHLRSVRVTAGLQDTLNGAFAQCVTIEFSGKLM